MDVKNVSLEQIRRYASYLQEEEKSPATILQYQREVLRFYLWLPKDKAVDKERALLYKASLQAQKSRSASTPPWPP